jgi:molybdenum cofactor cytidylyltransferase
MAAAHDPGRITAIILAAGESRRMGQPKMLLPWGDSTVLQTVLAAFRSAGIEDLVVITGGIHEQIEALIGRSARTIVNPDFAAGEMLSSIQAGLQNLGKEVPAALIGLGDQPQVRAQTVGKLIRAYEETGCNLAVPSFQQHRGHPWLVGRLYWEAILRMQPGETMRDFFRGHAQQIHYIEAEDASVLADLDTPEDYRKHRP